MFVCDDAWRSWRPRRATAGRGDGVVPFTTGAQGSTLKIIVCLLCLFSKRRKHYVFGASILPTRRSSTVRPLTAKLHNVMSLYLMDKFQQNLPWMWLRIANRIFKVTESEVKVKQWQTWKSCELETSWTAEWVWTKLTQTKCLVQLRDELITFSRSWRQRSRSCVYKCVSAEISAMWRQCLLFETEKSLVVFCT